MAGGTNGLIFAAASTWPSNGGPPLEDEVLGWSLRARLLAGGAFIGAMLYSPSLNHGEEAGVVQNILKPGGQWIGQAGSNTGIRIVPGGLTAAQQLFDQLTVDGTVLPSSYPGTLVSLPDDAGTVGLRMTGTSGDIPTIDVNIPGMNLREIKFPD